MAAGKKKDANREVPVLDYEHSESHRTNNPPAGLAHLDREETPTKTLQYDPHLDPQMQWAGKSERSSAEIPAPSVHVHEELSAQKIVGSVRKQRLQPALFDVADLDPAKAVEFYMHDMSWSNRMILGDSLVVMTSLVERERLSGQVQCIYLDPPYGVRYNSNFQPRIGDTNVTDKRDDDLTREPEMIQAYRDTWELGIHSYLTYLRDRLALSRELLSESGSVFLQISDDNVHLVRVLMDEVFGAENFISQITFAKTGTADSSLLPATHDFILWYARDRQKLRANQLFIPRVERTEGGTFTWVELPDGTSRKMTSAEKDGGVLLPSGSRRFRAADLSSQGESKGGSSPVEFEGNTYHCSKGRHWKKETVEELIRRGRVVAQGATLAVKRYEDDFPWTPLTHVWNDTVMGTFSKKRYVVQTGELAVERCVLMATQPGDLVIDPTCGSGTTALVCERFGRRWITIDTSRVAMSIARERILTSTFDYFELRDASRGVDSGFVYEVDSKLTPGDFAKGLEPEEIAFLDRPKVDRKKVRVSGPFTVEALSRYAINPSDDAPAAGPSIEDAADHVSTLLDALRKQGIPRPGVKPTKIESLTTLSGAGALQAEGVLDYEGKKSKFAVSLGPRFGAITMAQVSDALQDAIGFGLVVFAGFAVTAEAQAQLATGKVGGTDVALLMANPDLIAGDLLKNTSASQTFRLYASPDVRVDVADDGWKLTVEGVDSFDAATGGVMSFGRSGIQAWFLDDAYDGRVFRTAQAFFPVTHSWEKLSRALRGTVDSELMGELHSWTSLPFETPESGKIAIRVIADDGNASEVVVSVGPSGVKSR
jgi:adenine-specific DNA-methyltransferase